MAYKMDNNLLVLFGSLRYAKETRCFYLSTIWGVVTFLFIYMFHQISSYLFDFTYIVPVMNLNLQIDEVLKLLIFIPLFETVLFQFVPFSLGQAAGFHTLVSMLISIIFFSIAHHGLGIEILIINGISGGALLILWFSFWFQNSIQQAVIATWIAHATHNGLVICLGAILS